METEETVSRFELWKKIAVFVLVLCAVDVVLTLWERVRIVDLFFFEGLAVLVVGAVVASGSYRGEFMRRTAMLRAGVDYDSDGIREDLKKDHSKQVSDGIIVMLIGVILLVLAALSFSVGLG